MGNNQLPEHKPGEEYTVEFIEKLADIFLTWMKADEKNYLIGDFAFQYGFHLKQLDRFVKKNKKFAQTWKLAIQNQENHLVKSGLSGNKSAVMSIFVLKNRHGFQDRYDRRQDIKLPPVKIYVRSNNEKPRIDKESSIKPMLDDIVDED